MEFEKYLHKVKQMLGNARNNPCIMHNTKGIEKKVWIVQSYLHYDENMIYGYNAIIWNSEERNEFMVD